MPIDDLQAAWAAHGALLERSVAIDERLLRELLLGKVRRALAPYLAWRALELVLALAALGFALPILWRHLGEPRYLVAAGAVVAYLYLLLAFSIRLLVLGMRLDFGAPVIELQQKVERMKLTEFRALQWALLGGVLVWLPFTLVAFEALTGVNALARVNGPWLYANLLVGLGVLTIGASVSRRFVERPDLGPQARRFLEAASGRTLKSASSHLAELAAFTREDAKAGGR